MSPQQEVILVMNMRYTHMHAHTNIQQGHSDSALALAVAGRRLFRCVEGKRREERTIGVGVVVCLIGHSSNRLTVAMYTHVRTNLQTAIRLIIDISDHPHTHTHTQTLRATGRVVACVSLL